MLRSGDNRAIHGLWIFVRYGDRTKSNSVWTVHSIMIVPLALLPVMLEYSSVQSVETPISWDSSRRPDCMCSKTTARGGAVYLDLFALNNHCWQRY